MALADARAICPTLITRPADLLQEARGLTALTRLAGRWSPHVGREGADGLVLDLTGVSHLFGGEEALLCDVEARLADAGFESQGAIAPNRAAACALARHSPEQIRPPAALSAGQPAPSRASAQAARPATAQYTGGNAATPSRAFVTAAPRRMAADVVSPPPSLALPHTAGAPNRPLSAPLRPRIIADHDLLPRLGPLPVSALDLPADTVAGLGRLGLTRIRDLTGQPRSPLARRFGPDLLLRLDQVLGHSQESISPAPPPPHFVTRLTLPEPIGLIRDVMAGLLRLLERLCEILTRHQQGARRLVLHLSRTDRASLMVEIGLARAMRDPTRMAALFARGIEEIDAGFGIDAMRLSAPQTEPLAARQPGLTPARETSRDEAMADLVSRLGNRLGFARILRLAPSESLIPERSFLTFAAAGAPASLPPSRHDPNRPQILFPPEAVSLIQDDTPAEAPDPGHRPRCTPIPCLQNSRPDNTPRTTPPHRFRWRRMSFTTLRATGPERIAPEWWFDDPAWRLGLRDYWRVETREGRRLWLFHTPRGQDWSVQGEFV